MDDQASADPNRYRIGFRGGNIVFNDGPRRVEFGVEDKQLPNRQVECTLFAKTIRSWEYPYSDELITEAVREHILAQTATLLESQGSRENVAVIVIINRTDFGGSPY